MNKPVTRESLMQQAGRVPASQATQIEQSRAVAQVQGALVVARQNPRDEISARQRMESACQVQALADHAFFRFSRGGSQISGPSIHLATELARCWGNIDYGISELHRDDSKAESEMLAVAWDLETNTRVTSTFIVPHKRDKRGGPEVLSDMRDIYENNANQGARRLRECIFRVLPKAFVEEAKDACMKTLETGGGEPIEKRRQKTVEAFATLGVTRKQIERKMGRTADKFTPYDLGVLRTIYQSLRRGEISVGEEFEDDSGQSATEALKGKPAEKPAVEAAKEAADPAEAEGPVLRDAAGVGVGTITSMVSWFASLRKMIENAEGGEQQRALVEHNEAVARVWIKDRGNSAETLWKQALTEAGVIPAATEEVEA